MARLRTHGSARPFNCDLEGNQPPLLTPVHELLSDFARRVVGNPCVAKVEETPRLPRFTQHGVPDFHLRDREPLIRQSIVVVLDLAAAGTQP